MARRTLYIALTVAIIAIALTLYLRWLFTSDWVGALPPAATGTATPPGEPPLLSLVAGGLEVPWALDFLPDGSILLTERPGRVRLVDPAQGLLPDPVATLADVAAAGEGGLLGLAVHPDFPSTGWVYLYYTYRDPAGELANKLVRFRMQDHRLVEATIIVSGVPGGTVHDGGRIKFGPDGLLYIATGDAGNSALAQDRSSLAGKILRIEQDGSIPAENPFPGSPVFSYGHRNPEGLAWDSQGRLWATEHGSSATDEVNLVQPGRNYGWPLVRGDQQGPDLEPPVLHSGADTWAPSGMAFWEGSLFFGGLRGQSLFQLSLDSAAPAVRSHLAGQLGRLREVVRGPNGFLYLATSNRDGRGVPSAGDDRVLRLNPRRL